MSRRKELRKELRKEEIGVKLAGASVGKRKVSTHDAGHSKSVVSLLQAVSTLRISLGYKEGV